MKIKFSYFDFAGPSSATGSAVADLKVFAWVRSLRSGVLDHIPVDFTDHACPHLVEHFERIGKLAEEVGG